MVSNEQVNSLLGEQALSEDRYRNLDILADKMATAHWHASKLPWDELPLFPVPDGEGRRIRGFVEFGKRAIHVQLAAEHVALTCARHLSLCAERDGLHGSVRRAINALLNDEASHVYIMTEMAVRADRQYPDITIDDDRGPLLPLFMSEVPTLHPAVVGGFLGAYEAMIALRGYAEQAAYPRPSILGEMAGHAAADDARHAKVMRLVGHEYYDRIRAAGLDAKALVFDPIHRYWNLLLEHEKWLLRGDRRREEQYYLRAEEDAKLANRMLTLVGIRPSDLDLTVTPYSAEN